MLTPALELAGFVVEYKKIEMKTVDMAIMHQFVSSPTIRVNGQDICKSVTENNCAVAVNQQYRCGMPCF